MGAETIPGGRPRTSGVPRRHGHHNPPACHHAAYALSCAEFDQLHDDAAGRCQACDGFTTFLQVDHDHTLGSWAVRGLVCGRCNVRLGRVDRGTRTPTDGQLRYLQNPWHLTQDTAAKRVRVFPRAWCTYCRYLAPVRKDGRFSIHTTYGTTRCPGSGLRAPAAPSREESPE